MPSSFLAAPSSPTTIVSDDLARRLGLTEADEAHRRFIERGGDAPPEPAMSLALHVAAARELFEEAGVLLVGREAAAACRTRRCDP